MRKEEEELRVAIESMAREAEEARSRGNELWSGVGALKARKASEGGEREWAVVDEEGLRQVLEVRCSILALFEHVERSLILLLGRRWYRFSLLNKLDSITLPRLLTLLKEMLRS